MKKTYLLFFFLFCMNSLSATHIIGGSIGYEHVGGDQYRLRLEVIRDCFNGIPWFDNPASIGVFTSNGTLVAELLIPLGNINDTISLAVPNNICTFPPTICVNKTVYETDVTLPTIAGGYTVAYQRCCRTNIITNLIAPEDAGMTFYTHIDPALQNNSPVFNGDFPFAVFANTPFIYDGSATDPDGDSLVYELSAPFGGASDIAPMPQPPAGPPYDNVGFLLPNYSIDNMLGGSYPLAIGPKSGEMGAIPQALGVFQIAYSVNEFRNGVQIGTTYREFTFIVVEPLPNQNYDVSGSVLVNGNPLDVGQAQVMERNVLNDSLSVYAEQPLGAGATYSFLNIPAGVFYIKGIVDPSSMYHGNYLPTYYNSALFWYDADPVNQCDTSQVYRDIHLIQVDSLTGMHELKGLVVNPNGNNEPIADLDLLLGDENGKIVQARTTDIDGNFIFENLNSGNYEIYVDLINSAIDNSNPPIVEVNENTLVQAYLYDDSLTVETLVDVKPESIPGSFISVYPNPTNNNFWLSINAEKISICSAKLFNPYGQIIYSLFENKQLVTGENIELINLENMQAGIYFLEINIQGTRKVKKIVKQ